MAIWRRSARGPFRRRNEDLCLVARGRTVIAAVIDGMGGGPDGDLAAACVAEALRPLAAADLDASRGAAAIERGHALIRAERDRRGYRESMGAVVTAFWLDPRAPGWPYMTLHVGDTRGFAFSPSGCGRQLTRDESALDYGEAPDAVAMRMPLRKVVAAALGTDGALEPQVAEGWLSPGSLLVAASDGVGDYLSRVRLAELVARHPGHPEALGAAIFDAALAGQHAAGRGDNLSVVVLRRPTVSPGC